MRGGEKRVIAIATGITLIILVLIAYLVIAPSGVLSFEGHSLVRAGDAREGMVLEVGLSAWEPIGPWVRLVVLMQKLAGDSFWIIDGTKYTTVSATLKVKLQYYGIRKYTLNASIIRVWCEYSSKVSYIIKADPITKINSGTDGTYDRYSSNPFQGSKNVSTIASELSLPTSSSATVYYYYRVAFVGFGAITGKNITADTKTKQPDNRKSGTWEYYTESSSAPTTSASVSYSSWLSFDMGVFIGLLVFAAVFVYRGKRR